jgi:putative membrane protein
LAKLTTALSPERILVHQNRLLQALVGLYASVWIVTAINPAYPLDWLLENLLVFAIVPLLVFTHRRFQFSDISYVLITIFMCLHALGAHTTYAEQPIGYWMQDTFEFGRNHYDRVVHFSFGLLIYYPFYEWILRRTRLIRRRVFLVALVVSIASSTIFELLEWGFVVIANPEAGQAYLGTQGDVFDSQKDSFLAGLGALIAMTVTLLMEGRKKNN